MSDELENVLSDFDEAENDRARADEDRANSLDAERRWGEANERIRAMYQHQFVGLEQPNYWFTITTNPHDLGATHRLRYSDETEELLCIDGDAVLERL